MPSDFDFSADGEEIVDNFSEDVEFDPETEENELDTRMVKSTFTVTKYISMYDVQRAEISWRGLTDDAKQELLWSVGLDVKNYRYLTSMDEHITMEGLRKTCVRFICEERSDKAWIDTGLASDDAYLKYKNDPSFTREIKRMEDCYQSSVIEF